MDKMTVPVSKNLLKARRNPNFILLILGRFVSGMGNSIFGFAIGLYVLDLTQSASFFSITLSASIIPGIFVNILAGVFVDRSNKKKIMVITDILSGVVVLGFLLLLFVYPKSILLIIIYTVFISILQSLFSLAINASIPELISKDKVARINSVFQAANALISIVGPIIGAIAYYNMGIENIILLNGICLIAAGISEIFLAYEYKHPNIVNGESKSYFEDMKFTFVYLKKNSILAFFFILAVCVNFVYNPLLMIVLPYLNYNVIKISGVQLSFIQAAAAVGVILSAVLIIVNKSLERKLLSRFFKLLMIQSILIVMWVFPVLPFYTKNGKWSITITFCIILILYGALNTAQNVPVVTYFQKKVPDEIRGRIMGVFSTALYISSPLGMWVYGLLLENVNWTYITTVSGVLMMLISIFAPYHRVFREFIGNLDKPELEGENCVTVLDE